MYCNYLNISSHHYPFGMLMPGRSFNSPDYRFGFNGMEKDDEVKGITGSSYDFGARIYDPRVGRWWSMDPFKQEYVPYSPYGFALDNPIFFVDKAGDIIVDSKGKPITVSIHQAIDGIWKASYTYKDGTEVVDENFLEKGGRIINAMIQVPTGREQAQKMNDSKDKIHLTVSPENHIKVKEKDGVKIIKGKLGGTKITAIEYGNDSETGERIIKSVHMELTVYEGSIVEATKLNAVQEYLDNNLTQEQKIGRTAVHESVHTVEDVDIKANIENRKLTAEEHEKSKNLATKASREYGELNKQQKQIEKHYIKE